jgi:predicted GNAT family N-acyltransferase
MTSTAEASESSIKIGVAVTPEEKKEIYHFRYQTYVEEMSKHLEDIDYENKLLCDELDEWTILLYAKVDSTIIGTARVNIGNIEEFPEKVVDILSLRAFETYAENENQKFAYVTKLMVAPSYRRSPVLYLLIAKCYELCFINQVEFTFGGCNFHLVRLYEQMGFHHYGKKFVYPGYGLLTPIVLVINDIPHLRRVRSPFFRIARKRKNVNTQAVEWFHKNFMKHSLVNSQLITEDELWSIICNFLHRPPTEAITILRELSEAEAKKFLHSCGNLVQCDTGDIITNQGDISYSYNILLTGQLRSLTFHHPIKQYTISGQHFGANGLTEHNKNTEDIAAITPTQILVLSGMAFPRFFHSQPDIAHKIVQAMKKPNQ